MGWFVIGPGGRTGPFSDETIVQLLRDGRLGRGGKVSRDDGVAMLVEESPFAALLAPATPDTSTQPSLSGASTAGAPRKRSSSAGFWLIVSLLVGGGVYWLGRGDDRAKAEAEARARAEQEEVDGAWDVARQFVEQELKAPGSARFGERDVQSAGPSRYRISGWVDAQNSFGAKVRNRFTVTVEKTGERQWKAAEGPTLSAW